MANPPPLQVGQTYHIYNRGNNGEDVFREERNYAYFLNLFAEKVLPIRRTSERGVCSSIRFIAGR